MNVTMQIGYLANAATRKQSAHEEELFSPATRSTWNSWLRRQLRVAFRRVPFARRFFNSFSVEKYAAQIWHGSFYLLYGFNWLMVFLAKVASWLTSFGDVFWTNAPLIYHLENSFYWLLIDATLRVNTMSFKKFPGFKIIWFFKLLIKGVTCLHGFQWVSRGFHKPSWARCKHNQYTTNICVIIRQLFSVTFL